MKCVKCGEINKENAKFCASCGEKLELKKVFCTECGHELESDNAFCENCGAKKENTKKIINLKKLNIKKIGLSKIDLSNKIISVSFLICAIIGIYLFRSNGFFRWLFNGISITANNMALLSIIIGLIIFFVKRKNIDINEMLKRFTKMSFDKNVVSFIFIISGVLIYILQTNEVFRVEILQVIVCFVAFFSFSLLCLTILAINWDILKKPFLVLVVVIGLSLFILLGSSKRIAKKAVNFLENNNFTCVLNDDTYTCQKNINGRIEEWEINYYMGINQLSIYLKVYEDDYYSLRISKQNYYREGFVTLREEGNNCYYVPEFLSDNIYLENEYLEVGTRVVFQERYSGDDCRNRSSFVNEYLRKYESLYNYLNISIK